MALLAVQGLLNLILILSLPACANREQPAEQSTTQEQQREGEKAQEGA